MKVKIGDKVYDGAEQPIMVILGPEDKQNISNMEPHADRYCSYPEEMSPQEAMEFMGISWEDDDVGQPIPPPPAPPPFPPIRMLKEGEVPKRSEYYPEFDKTKHVKNRNWFGKLLRFLGSLEHGTASRRAVRNVEENK